MKVGGRAALESRLSCSSWDPGLYVSLNGSADPGATLELVFVVRRGEGGGKGRTSESQGRKTAWLLPSGLTSWIVWQLTDLWMFGDVGLRCSLVSKRYLFSHCFIWGPRYQFLTSVS